MTLRRFSLFLLLAGSWTARGGENHDVFTSVQIDRMLAHLQSPAALVTKNNYAIVLRFNSGPPTPWVINPEADEFWFVRHGNAKVSLADFTLMAGVAGGTAKQYSASSGDVISIPRSKAYQVEAGADRFDYIAVRIFPSERRARPGGRMPNARPMPTVAFKSKIEETIAGSDKNVTLHSAGVTLINQVVYDRVPGPWEVHMACDDLYFWRIGIGKAQIDGTLVHPKEDQPGEIRGFGVIGSREYTVGPGDFVFVPRNTAHHMDGGDAKLGYVLVKICD